MRALLVSPIGWLVACVVATGSIAIAKPTPEAFPGAELPDVTRVQDKRGASSGVTRRETATLVIASPTAITVGGKAIVTIDKGAVDAAEKEGGSSGNKIGKLADALPGTELVELGIDKKLTYKILFEMLYSGKQSGRSTFALLVRAGGSVSAVPIVLPTQRPPAGGLKMVVSVSKKEALIWSFSGKEGTLKKPRLRGGLDDTDLAHTTAASQIGTMLEVVAARWKGKKRPAETQSIVLMCDGDTSIQFVAELMVAIRPHFSDISLSAGFE